LDFVAIGEGSPAERPRAAERAGRSPDQPLFRSIDVVSPLMETDETPAAAATDAATILVVDDALSNVEILRETLRAQGHKILAATSGRECLAIALQCQPDLILLDVMMPEMDGLEVCRILKADPLLRTIPLIFCSALDDADAKVEGLGAGAVDFITKPYEAAEVVARVNLQLAIRGLQRGLEERNADLERELALAHELRRDALRSMQEALIGTSEAMVRLRGAIEAQARESSALLLLAEAGCGEEAVARAIHDASARQKRPFVAVECAQLAASDLSSTSKALGLADVLGRSKLDLASGGTLFLWGVNNLATELQAPLYELLVHLETACGPACEAHAGLRLVASATVDTSAGTFPSDFDKLLIERLTRHVLRLPTVAERREDIPALVSLFAERHARRLGRVLEGPSESTMARLVAYSWPGNLRELEDVIRRSIRASRGPRLEVAQALLSEGIPFGSYRLLRKLGHGGMGEVWEARHDLLARPAAVKLIRTEQLARTNKEALRRRFEREARATANLRCQHTVTLYDFGVGEDGVFYYVMELLGGIDLERLVEGYGPMPASRVVHLLEQACRSLAEAHASGLVHRDIKPANLFVCKLGLEVDQLKVLDFGMVSCEPSPDETRVSMADEIYGTPECISPEAATGVPDIDGRADIYGLGCVAYWMLTGKVVFEAASALGMLLRHIKDTPEPPSARGAFGIPKPLEDLIMSCLAKDRERRPTALEMLDGLKATGLAEAWSDAEAREWWMSHLPNLMGK
jgi:DNA-binding NtrC family response regulator